MLFSRLLLELDLLLLLLSFSLFFLSLESDDFFSFSSLEDDDLLLDDLLELLDFLELSFFLSFDLSFDFSFFSFFSFVSADSGATLGVVDGTAWDGVASADVSSAVS